MEVSIVPYHPSYDNSIAELEQKIWQGRLIRLKIIKENFLSRAHVFKHYHSYLALDKKNQVIGTAVNAHTQISINQQLHDCSMGFDVKVDPAFRNQGIGRKLAQQVIRTSNAEGIRKHMTTMKSSNTPVIRLLSKAIARLWFYPFVYLTIPTHLSIESKSITDNQQQFKVSLFNPEGLDDYFKSFNGGLACFFTHKLYRLKIDKISPLYKLSLQMARRLQPSKYEHLPTENDEMKFASLYNHTSENIESLNKVLKYLQQNNINFLQVCCSKRDSLYKYLKKYSINTYSYTLISDFKLSTNDKVVLDVRCL